MSSYSAAARCIELLGATCLGGVRCCPLARSPNRSAAFRVIAGMSLPTARISEAVQLRQSDSSSCWALQQIEHVAGVTHPLHGSGGCLEYLALALRPPGNHRLHTGEDITLCAHPQLGLFNKGRANR